MAKKKVVRKKTVKKTARSGAKSRTTAARKKTAAKPARKKTAAKKKPVAKKKPARKASPTQKKTVKKKVVAKKAPTGTTVKKTTKKTSLGRPRVPADARLDLVFQKDYQAREVFEFLQVSTVRELERFGADEIIQKLTSPMIQTVGRIRKALAVANRSMRPRNSISAKNL